MNLINKYPIGHWEYPEDDERNCPICGDDLQVFVVEETSPTGRAVEYIRGERCLSCDWEAETD